MGLEKSAWTTEGVARVREPSPLESFEAFEREARSGGRPGADLRPVLDCPLPYLDVYLFDPDGAPIEGAPCELAFPGGGGQRAETDSAGLAHFPDLEVDASTLMCEVLAEEDEEGRVSYRVRVLPRAGEPEASGEERQPEPEPIYHVGAELLLE